MTHVITKDGWLQRLDSRFSVGGRRIGFVALVALVTLVTLGVLEESIHAVFYRPLGW